MEREQSRGEKKEGKTGKGGYEEEERGSRAESTGRKAKEDNVGVLDEGRGRGGRGHVLEAEAPFSAAPYSPFLSPRFVWFCLQSVDWRQHISAASAALVRQMGRDGGPGPGTHALARALGGPLPSGTLRFFPPRSSRPRGDTCPGPQGRAEPPNPARGVGSGCVLQRGWASEQRRRQKPNKKQKRPVGRRRSTHAGGTGDRRPHSGPSSRSPGGPARAGLEWAAVDASSTCAGRPESARSAPAASSARPRPRCPTRRPARAARPRPGSRKNVQRAAGRLAGRWHRAPAFGVRLPGVLGAVGVSKLLRGYVLGQRYVVQETESRVFSLPGLHLLVPVAFYVCPR